MPDDPWYIKILDKMGVNTTRLRWRVYQQEQHAKNLVQSGGPGWLSWMRYPHKQCSGCSAINDREAKTCSSCGKRLPSMFMYRVSRLGRTIAPAEGPVVTITFLSLIVLFFFVEFAANGFNPGTLMRPSSASLIVIGAFIGELAVEGREFWRFLSFGLIHGNLIHFAMIAYSLYQIGPFVEMQLNRAKMLGLITATQIGAAGASYIWYDLIRQDGSFTVGGSGWLYGLMGFGIVFFHQMGEGGRPMRDSLLRWAVLWLVFGMIIPGINNAAHIGGLVVGMTFARLPEDDARHVRQNRAVETAAFWICAAAWCLTLIFMVRSIIRWWPDLMEM